jgi:unsaturated rhamnogalacturonyl hydrolase
MDTGRLIEKVKNAMLCMERYPWEQGEASQALIELGDYESAYLMAHDAVLRQSPDGRLGTTFYIDHVAMFGDTITATDAANNGQAVLYFAQQGNEEFMKASHKMLDFLMKKAPRAQNGAISHVLDHPQVWVDSIHHCPPFIAQMGKFDEAVRQISAMRELVYDSNTKLMYHVWDDVEKRYVNDDFWGIGIGLALMGMVKTVQYLVDDKHKSIIKEYAIELLDTLLLLKDKSGMFHNIVNDESSFLEADLSAEVACAIYSAIHQGWLDESIYRSYADQMRTMVHKCVDSHGFFRNVCGAPTFAALSVSVEAQAMFLQMEASAKKLEL